MSGELRDRFLLVYDEQEDDWLVRGEGAFRALDPDRYSAEWAFDSREEAEEMLREALGSDRDVE